MKLWRRVEQTFRRIVMGPRSRLGMRAEDELRRVAGGETRAVNLEGKPWPDAGPTRRWKLIRLQEQIGGVGPYLLPERWLLAIERALGRPPWYNG